MVNYEVVGVSGDFLLLCESQLKLLFSQFSAQVSTVYLTQGADGPTLVPIITYPQQNSQPELPLLPPFVEKKWGSVLASDNNVSTIVHNTANPQLPHQLILPLIYQGLVFGLLVISREDKPWQASEIIQIREITQTIAVACFLEKKQKLTAEKLVKLQQLRGEEHQLLDDFLHQLRNPLTAIITLAKLLLKKLSPGDGNYKAGEVILRESERMRELIADFSEQFKLEKETSDLAIYPQHVSFFLTEKIEEFTPVDLKRLLEEVLISFKVVAQEKNIEILTEIEEDLQPIISNKKALREIINNLMDNALKYTPENGKVKLQLSRGGGRESIVKN
ncbi:MAG: GAF domain-containing sensor histidine kinase [Geminocystis sp.]|nr:GAF domain-containing sensor histidine kinase [Geminocystis sp.]